MTTKGNNSQKSSSIIMFTLLVSVFLAFMTPKQCFASEPETIVDYSSTADQIYTEIKENLHTGQYIDTGITIPFSEVKDFAFYMQIYFLGENPTLSYGTLGENDLVNIYVLPKNLTECISQHEKALEIITSVVNGMDKELSDEEKLNYFISYLKENFTYDHSLQNKTAYAMLTKGSGICHSYSATMAWLCKLSDIPCEYIKGERDGLYHAWNKVCVGNNTWKLIENTATTVSECYVNESCSKLYLPYQEYFFD